MKIFEDLNEFKKYIGMSIFWVVIADLFVIPLSGELSVPEFWIRQILLLIFVMAIIGATQAMTKEAIFEERNPELFKQKTDKK